MAGRREQPRPVGLEVKKSILEAIGDKQLFKPWFRDPAIGSPGAPS